MKSFLSLTALCAILCFGCSVKLIESKNETSPSFHVSGKVNQTFSYCGGANPPEFLLEELAMPKPIPSMLFYVIEGNINSNHRKIIKKFMTDSNGMFDFELPVGKYSIILQEQTKELNMQILNTKTQKADEDCLKEWWQKPYYSFEIRNQNISNLEFLFVNRCFIDGFIPCITYTGQMPP
jgi:hypothetical protein